MGIFDRIGQLLPFGRRSNAVLGMDIGTDAVRLALVEREGRRPVVRWVHEESLTALQGFADFDSVGPLLQAALRGRFDKRVDVATVPPWSSARVSVQEFPTMDPARFSKASAWYFQRNPVDDMDHPMNHAVAQSARVTPDGNDVMDGVMVSMDEIMLDGLEGLCAHLRLRLRSILPRPLCFAPLVSQQFGARHAVLAVDIGAGQTRLTLIVDGNVRLVRRIKPCANDVVRHICDAAGLSWEEANLALMAHSDFGRLADEDPDGIVARAQASTEKYLDRLATQLTGEIERSIAYVEARHTTPVTKVCLSGGLAGSPYLVESLSSSIHHDVERLDPFANEDSALEVPLGARAHYNLAIGAAVLALSGDGQRNILLSRQAGPAASPESRMRFRLPRSRMAATAIGAGILLGAAGHDLVQTRELHRLERASAGANERLAALSAEADSLSNQRDLFDLADRIEALRDIYDQRQLYTPFLAEVVRDLPAEVWLTQLSVQQVKVQATREDLGEDGATGAHLQAPTIAHRLRVSGRSLAVDRVGQVVMRLETSRILDRIEVLKIDEVKNDSGGEGGFRFEIEGTPVIARRTERAPEIDPEAVAR